MSAYILLLTDVMTPARAMVYSADDQPVYLFNADIGAELGEMIQNSEYADLPFRCIDNFDKLWRPEPGYSVAECVEACWQ